MKSKIKSLKQLFQSDQEDRYYPVIPKQYVDYCEGDEMPAGLFQNKTTQFRFYFTKYPLLQSPSQCHMAMDNPLDTKFSYKSFEVDYNSIQKKLFERLYDTVPLFDNTWFQHNDEFIHNLSISDKFALVAMTNKSQQHIQAYLKGQDLKPFKDRVRKWRPDIHGYLPIFFPLIQKLKLRKEKKKLSELYQYIVETICPTLTDHQIDECLVQLVQQIRHLFSICPKTTQKMTLWRGIRATSPSLSHSGFISMSLNPFHTLNYTGKECCLQKVTILPKTHLLFIGGLSSFKNELECVLPDQLQFYEIKKTMENIPIVLKMKEKCPPPKDIQRVLIHHVVAL